MLSLLLLITPVTLPQPPAAAPLVDRDDKWERRQEKAREKEERRHWKAREKEEKRYWKMRRKEARHHYHDRDEDRDDHRDWDHARPRHRHACPPWMTGYWRPGQKRYVALVPNDPSRIYVFLDGRWALRRLTDPRAHADLSGALRLPLAPPPVPLPRLPGLDLHVVLFD